MSQIRIRINGKEVPQLGESSVSLEMALPGGDLDNDTCIVLQLSDEGLSFEFIDGSDGQNLGMHRQVVVSVDHLRDLALDRREIRLSLMENDDCAVRQEDITDMAGRMIAESVLDRLQDADELGGVDTPEQYVTLMYFVAATCLQRAKTCSANSGLAEPIAKVINVLPPFPVDGDVVSAENIALALAVLSGQPAVVDDKAMSEIDMLIGLRVPLVKIPNPQQCGLHDRYLLCRADANGVTSDRRKQEIVI